MTSTRTTGRRAKAMAIRDLPATARLQAGGINRLVVTDGKIAAR